MQVQKVIKRLGHTSKKGDKRELRRAMHLTRPPRMEGKVKEAMMQPKRKRKKQRKEPRRVQKMQGFTQRQRADYQLKSARH